MQNSGGFFDLIVLGLMIWFIYSRFMSNNLPKDDKKSGKGLNTASVLPFKEKKISKPKKSLSGMEELKSIDTSFNEKAFANGSKSAFSFFYKGISEQDEDLLESLTSPKLFDETMDKIEDKIDSGVILKIDVKEITSVDIVDTRIAGTTAIISVKYTAKIVEYEENIKTKKITKNTAKKAKTVKTIWTWAKPIDSNDPNWELEEINALS